MRFKNTTLMILLSMCFIHCYYSLYSQETRIDTIRQKYKDILLSSLLIIIDIDPHNGILEYEMYAGTKRTDKLVDGVQLDI